MQDLLYPQESQGKIDPGSQKEVQKQVLQADRDLSAHELSKVGPRSLPPHQ